MPHITAVFCKSAVPNVRALQALAGLSLAMVHRPNTHVVARQLYDAQTSAWRLAEELYWLLYDTHTNLSARCDAVQTHIAEAIGCDSRSPLAAPVLLAMCSGCLRLKINSNPVSARFREFLWLDVRSALHCLGC